MADLARAKNGVAQRETTDAAGYPLAVGTLGREQEQS